MSGIFCLVALTACIGGGQRDSGGDGPGGSGSGGGSSISSTDDVPEGSTNFYFTDGRADTRAEARIAANVDIIANTAARHDALTLGTPSGLSLSGQELSLQLASSVQTGALSSTDFTTFNGKESDLGTPLTNGQLLSSTTGGLRSWVSFSDAFDPSSQVLLYDDWISGGAAGELGWTAVNSGTGAASATNTTSVNNLGRPGIMSLTTGTTATGRAALHLGTVTTQLDGGAIEYRTNVFIPSLSDGTNTYLLRVGLGDQTTATDFTDGVYFEYVSGTSLEWRIATASNNTRTKVNSGTLVATNAWQNLRFVVEEDASSVEFFVNSISVGTVSTNIPIGTTRLLGPIYVLAKSLGTTARLVYFDYFLFRQNLSAAR